MRAMVCSRYGPPEVLEAAEVPTPAPADNEILIAIRATTCHISDTRFAGSKPATPFSPAHRFCSAVTRNTFAFRKTPPTSARVSSCINPRP